MTMAIKAWLHWIAAAALAIIPACTSAQTLPPPSTNPPSEKALMTQLVALRDSFVGQIKGEGFQPSLPPPDIILDNQPSFGA